MMLQSCFLLHSQKSVLCKSGVIKHVYRTLKTSAVPHKRTPATIGIMSWVRSANRRRYLEQKMKDIVKSESGLIKEEQLSQSEPKIEFLNSSRIHDKLNEDTMHSHLIRPTVFLSKDRQTVICYHPPPKSYPEEFTKRAVGKSLFGMSEDLINTFKSSMTDDEIKEAKTLQTEDPRLWNSNALSKLFKVKPEVMSRLVPMSKHDFVRAEAEKEVYKAMSVMKRKQFRDLQHWQRQKYVRETRGQEFANWYKQLDIKPKSRAYAPPKL